MTRILIDTNVYSHALLGTADVVDQLRGAEEISVCVITIGELLSGFKGGTREKENRKQLALFLDAPRVRVLSIDDDTADFYAETLHALKKIGRPIPTNDLWIGAVALQHGLKVFSRDRHFQFIPGLICIG
jgi:predicted nucleic acid-binding protein